MDYINRTMDEHDRQILKWVKLLNPYDLYSKKPQSSKLASTETILQRFIGSIFISNLKILAILGNLQITE
ncbi:inositol oxygenase family protein [Scytonema sp. NUACC21]